MHITSCGLFLRLWNSKGNFVAIRGCHKGAFFLGGCEACCDVAKCDAVMAGGQLEDSDKEEWRWYYVFARTPNEGPHSLAMTFERPVTPAFALAHFGVSIPS